MAHLSVFDPDDGKNGEVDCTLTGDHFVMEEIYSGEYKIINLTPLDREIQETYNIQVRCNDNGFPQRLATKNLQVTVIDVNDNRPVFSQTSYTATLVENNLVGAFLLDVNAVDSDTGYNAEILYSLDDRVTNLFDIDGKSGTITAKVTFDHEEVGEIFFTVTAVDGGQPRLTSSAGVSVVILDANDEQPTFSQESYSFSVDENQPPGTLVGTVHASYLDSDPYNQFEYSFVPSHASTEFFNIQPYTGEITTSVVLDREETSMYSLIVVAVDMIDPWMSSTATVLINIMDTNDNAPVFEYPSSDNNTIEMSNLADLGDEVTQVRAFDKDIGRNGQLTYEFYKGNEEGFFYISSFTGDVYVAKSLRDIDDEPFQLLIVAKDQGMPQMSSITNLNIAINNSVPVGNK